MRAPIGLRIRNYRKSKSLTQAELARSVEISASYLNLIEANKRHVGGALLHRIAAQLQVDLYDLTGETEQRLISELHEAFVDPLLAPLKLGVEDAHRLVALFPEGARALHICFRGYLDALAALHQVSNRVKSDPLFSELLHQMLSQITAVRSVAEILENVPDIDDKARRDFYRSIYSESIALSDAARALIGEFDRDSERHVSITPARQINDLIIGENNYFPILEKAAGELRHQLALRGALSEQQLAGILRTRFDISPAPAAFVPENAHAPYSYDELSKTIWFNSRTAPATRKFQLAKLLAQLHGGAIIESLVHDRRLTSPEVRNLARGALASYLAGALIFPYEDFLLAAEKTNYDLEQLARTYDASFEQIAHRLVTLRKPGAQGIPFGFLRADPSGFLTKQFPLPGLLMPNAGHACPLWAVYVALRSPGQMVRQIASYADGSRFLFLAKMTTKPVAAFHEPPVLSSVMLVCDLIHADKTVYGKSLSLSGNNFDTKVGPSCRLCVRQNCAHRQEAIVTAPAAGKAKVQSPA